MRINTCSYGRKGATSASLCMTKMDTTFEDRFPSTSGPMTYYNARVMYHDTDRNSRLQNKMHSFTVLDLKCHMYLNVRNNKSNIKETFLFMNLSF